MLPGGAKPAAILVDSGRVAEVRDYEEVGNGHIVDYGELIVGPGLVDAHVHINEPGRTEWEGFRTATRAAAAGGVTTLVDMPLNSSPVTTSVAALSRKRESAADQCQVDVAFYGGLVRGGASRVRDLTEAGVAGIKAFLCDSGLDEFPAAGADDLLAAAEVLAPLGVPLLAHAELPIGVGPTMGDARRYAEYLASRPKQWEADAIELLIHVCRETGCRVHIVHLANSDALEAIRAAREEGLPLTVETCPHYLHFAAEQIEDGDTRFKCAPPIRESLHREALWLALKSGEIDTIGSDHSPCPPAMKKQQTGDFLAAWGGIAGLQLTLPVVAHGARIRDASFEQIFNWTSRRPAELFGLGLRKGEIAEGYDADFVVLDPAKEWRVDAGSLLHRHKLTPYAGEPLSVSVVATFLRGQQVYVDGQVVGKPAGELIESRFATTDKA